MNPQSPTKQSKLNTLTLSSVSCFTNVQALGKKFTYVTCCKLQGKTERSCFPKVTVKTAFLFYLEKNMNETSRSRHKPFVVYIGADAMLHTFKT